MSMRESDREREAWLAAIGRAVRARREELGISQEKLGYRAGFHRTYVSDLERGQRNATAWTLRCLAAELGVTASGILAAAEEEMGTEG